MTTSKPALAGDQPPQGGVGGIAALPAWPENEDASARTYQQETEFLDDMLTAALARMEDLMEYAQHSPSCGIGGQVNGKPTGCDCGLSELLAACERRQDP